MAFKKRQKENIVLVDGDSAERKAEKTSSSAVLSTNIKTMSQTERENEYFRQQACKILDILESRGIDIYEEGRYGGMYLNGRNRQNNLIKNIPLKKTKKSEINQKQQQDQQLLNQLFNKN